jgi:hypothetical protein
MSTGTVFLGSPHDRKVKSPTITCKFYIKEHTVDKKYQMNSTDFSLELEYFLCVFVGDPLYPLA